MSELRYKIKGKIEYKAFFKWYNNNKKELYNLYYSICEELDEEEFLRLIVSLWQDVRYKEYVIKN